MIVLHLSPWTRGFFLWGEAAAPAEKRKPVRRARSAVRALPFGAERRALAAAIGELSPDVKVDSTATDTRFVWMPSAAGEPIPSSPLIAEVPVSDEALALAPWSVAVVPVTVSALENLLAVTSDRGSVVPGIVVGSDWSYWATALRFAWALVTREQMLPGMTKVDGRWHASWEPIFTGADADRLVKLARAMPGASRALSEDARRAPATRAVDVLTDAMHGIVDHLARCAATNGRVLPASVHRRAKLRFDSLHDQWLHALRSPDGAMDAADEELAGLAQQIREWRRPIDVLAAAPVKLCFRLEEPAVDSNERAAPWHVRFLLQPGNDPSLLIEADEVWKRRPRKLAAIKLHNFNLREYLLAALGHASGMCTRIESSLKSAAPAGYELGDRPVEEESPRRSPAPRVDPDGVWWDARRWRHRRVRHSRRWLDRGVARATGRAHFVCRARGTGRFPGNAAPLPAARVFVARVPATLGLRRLPRRRYGARQDHSSAHADSTRVGSGRARRCF